MSSDIKHIQLLDALRVEDQKIVQLGEALEKAQADFDVGSVRYAAVRDMVWNTLGDPFQLPEADKVLPSKGKYRFLGMAMGDAVMHVINEESHPVHIATLRILLHEGGLRDESGREADGRSVNAALMTLVRTGQVRKIDPEEEDGLNHYEAVIDESDASDWEDEG